MGVSDAVLFPKNAFHSAPSKGTENRSSATDVDGRTPLGVRLGLPQHLAGDRGGIPLSEQKVAEQVHDGVALCPPEVAMRSLAGRVAQVEQQSGYGVRYGRAFGTQH